MTHNTVQNIKIPPQALNNLSAQHMEDTFTRAKKLGVDPAKIFAKLVRAGDFYAAISTD